MIKCDFHGYKLEDALREVEVIIGEVRTAGNTEVAEFITGHGFIQKGLLTLCEQYGLDAKISWTNSGAINVVIE